MSSERAIILEFLAKMLEICAKNEFKFAKLSAVMSDKSIDGSYEYWRNGVRILKYAWYNAGGDCDSCKAILERIRNEFNAEQLSTK